MRMRATAISVQAGKVGCPTALVCLRAMAAAAGDDIPAQLAALLGKEAVQIRKTSEKPPRVSIIDLTVAVSGGSQHDAARTLRRLSDQYPEVGPNWPLYKFKGRRQRDTPVTNVRSIVEIIMLLRGRHASQVRRQAAELLCRWLGGDLAIIDEVCALRGFQEELAVRTPEDPRRIFGEAVEVAGTSSCGPSRGIGQAHGIHRWMTRTPGEQTTGEPECAGTAKEGPATRPTDRFRHRRCRAATSSF